MPDASMPVVLHHGLFGVGEMKIGPLKLSYFRGIDQAIAGQGHPLIITRVHPSSSIEKRARQLKENLLRQLTAIGRPRDKVILIGHSMGGLDARYAVARLGLAERVAAVVTVTCPYRGSPFADWVVKHLGLRLGGINLIRFLGVDLRAILDLTTSRCAVFNEQVKDVPGIPYFSVSAAQQSDRLPIFAVRSHRLVQAAEGENDGLVSVRSSTWGKHLGV
jgi:triacylglycerol lipase